MKADDFVQKFEIGLDKLKAEIEQYPDEAAIWATQPGINNSAGNLCLHLLGNLNHYVGAGIGKTGYTRNRPLEFSDDGIERQKLLDVIDQARRTVTTSIRSLPTEGLTEIFEGGDTGSPTVTVEAELLNILTHFNYHLGQINYHRRLTTQ